MPIFHTCQPPSFSSICMFALTVPNLLFQENASSLPPPLEAWRSVVVTKFFNKLASPASSNDVHDQLQWAGHISRVFYNPFPNKNRTIIGANKKVCQEPWVPTQSDVLTKRLPEIIPKVAQMIRITLMEFCRPYKSCVTYSISKRNENYHWS